MRLLIAEDNRAQANTFRRALAERGFAADVCHSGDQAVQAARQGLYNMVLLDWNLPELDGLTVCRELRSAGCVAYIMMVSVRSDVRERVAALDAGADDYMVKPVDLSELLAKAGAVARRAKTAQLVKVGTIELAERGRQLRIDGRAERLTPREFSLLSYLLQREGQVVTRAEIIDHVWASYGELGSNVVDVYAKRLRAKLGAVGIHLKTVRGIGFCLALPEDMRNPSPG